MSPNAAGQTRFTDGSAFKRMRSEEAEVPELVQLRKSNQVSLQGCYDGTHDVGALGCEPCARAQGIGRAPGGGGVMQLGTADDTRLTSKNVLLSHIPHTVLLHVQELRGKAEAQLHEIEKLEARLHEVEGQHSKQLQEVEEKVSL